MDFAERLNQLMSENKITSKELSEHLHLGKNTIKYWKDNGNIPRWNTLNALAEFFGVSVDYLLGKTDIKEPVKNIVSVGALVSLPLISSIRAGYDGQVVEYNDNEYEAIPCSMLHGYPPDECRLFIVKGDSMYPRILDGDMILIHVQSSVDSGDIAVVMYNGDEATVKRVRYVTNEDWVELIPMNPEYPTKRIEDTDLENCRVFGKVIGLLGNI